MCGAIGTLQSREEPVSFWLLNKMNRCPCVINKTKNSLLDFNLIVHVHLPGTKKPCRSAGNVKKNLFKNNILMSNKMLMLFNFLGETLDSLGIGIIDIKGGKVVKIGKSKYYA